MAFQDFFAIGLQSNRNRREPAGALRALTTMTNYTALNVARQLPLFAADEPALYLDDDDDRGYFSILVKQADGSKAQTSYPLENLTSVVEMLDPARDTWISQASFYRRNRRVVNLKSVGLSFLDIDCYRLDWARSLSPDEMAKQFVKFCESRGVPSPSLIIFSGRGLQPKWLFEKAVPQRALPRWNLVQKVLVSKLEAYGADPMARDASRVLRLVETVNSRSGCYCHVVHVTQGFDGQPKRYPFDAFADLLLPFTRAELSARREALAAQAVERSEKLLKSSASVLTLDTLNWGRLLDLRALVALRGGIDEGMRMLMLAYQMNFLALSRQVTTKSFFIEALQVAKAIDPTWSFHTTDLSSIIGKFKEALAGKTVLFAGRKYSPLYTPKNDTLINLFQITDEEQRRMKTIISSEIKKERKLEAQEQKRRQDGVMAREDYEDRANARQAQALELARSGMKVKDIAKVLGVSRQSVNNYLKGS